MMPTLKRSDHEIDQEFASWMIQEAGQRLEHEMKVDITFLFDK